MIVLDASAIVAIALGEPEEEDFNNRIVTNEALVGTPTLFESRMVLTRKVTEPTRFFEVFLAIPEIHPIPFTLAMYHAATEAFARFGRGSGHPAKLNFGDCLSYAVARDRDLPLLYKGDDFAKTDIRSALA